ncbi:MAG: FG-GAP-like repeat-containing protein [Candidatus Methanoperedens sp.]
MKKLILFLIVLLMITTASTGIEQHAGFPINTGSAIKTRVIAQDIDGDGKIEIIAASENRMVKVFDSTGTLKWENTGGKSENDEARTPFISNLSGDSRLEILSYGNPGCSSPDSCTASGATFYMWDASGIKLREIWIGKYLVSPPAVTKEGIILAGVANASQGTKTQATGVYAFNPEGTALWYLELGRSVNYKASIQVGDIDGDGMDEAVILTHDINAPYPADGKVWVIKVDYAGGTVLWSADLGGDARGAAIADLDNDGKNEVVVTSSSGLYIFDRNGAQINKFNIISNKAAPAIGDIDGDGVNEVVTASSDDKKIYIISKGNLRDFSSIGRITTNAALGDLNGDGELEIAGGDNYGSMYIWDYNGNLMEQARVTFDEFTSALITDLDKDGNKEVIMGNNNGYIYAFTFMSKPKDTIPPVTTDNTDELWHNSNVAITLTAVDENSGVAAAYYTIDGSEPTINSEKGNTITLSEDGIYTLKYFSVDNAGNVEKTKSAVVRIDKTPPATKDNADRLWHNGTVTVTLTPSDTGSGLKETYYIVDDGVPVMGTDITISGEGNHTIKYYSVDNAGNAEPLKETEVRIDNTSPVTSDDSDNKWYNKDVILNLNARDTLSGVEALYYSIGGSPGKSDSGTTTLPFSSEGVHIIDYYSVDNAGNIESTKTAVVRIDKTNPITVDDADGEWHNSGVVVKLTASDNLAGPASTYYSVTSGTATWLESMFSWLKTVTGQNTTQQGENVAISDEGIFNVHYYSTDNAGNMEPEKVSGLVKIDRTPPVLAVSSPVSKTYLHSDIITFGFSAEDSLSGIRTTNSAIDGARQVTNGQSFSMLGLDFGAHEFTLTSGDNAGNTNSQKVVFNVIATIDSLQALTEQGTSGSSVSALTGSSSAWITSNGVANSLKAKLNSAKAKINAGQNAAARNILEAYVNEVEAQTGKAITPEGAGILKAEARYVIERL